MHNPEKLIQTLQKHHVFKTDGPLPAEAATEIAASLPEARESSICASRGRTFALCGSGENKKLFIISPDIDPSVLAELTGFEPEKVLNLDVDRQSFLIESCALTAVNAAALRTELPFTAPAAGGIETAFGLGDRIGVATPGHIRAVRGYDVFPILPQQSIREMHRTTRTPENVIDDVSWAVFQEGFRRPFGADADHLKDEEAVRLTTAAGFTMFTIDPSDYINDRADGMGDGALAESFELLFKDNHDERNAMLKRYLDRRFDLENEATGFASIMSVRPRDLIRIAVKYLPAVLHTIKLARLIRELKGNTPFDLEMSVDETATPTTPEAHLFIITELKNAGVTLQGLAPRFTGEFQKGIDFIGDIKEFTRTARMHALIARAMGPYKLSIHSGSDKFSIFPIIAQLTAGLFHEKTAGTSYLEAIRVISRRDPALYRDIHAFALKRFETDRASYHVTTNLNAIPALDKLSDADLPALLDNNDSRQLIHITYGSALTETAGGKHVYRDRILKVLNDNEEDHYNTLAGHIIRHCDSLGLAKI